MAEPRAIRRPRPRVVIVGGGFAGLACVRALRRADADITLIDRRNHHLFQPLLYQVATAALSPANIAAPIRRILRKQPNCTVVMGGATAVDPDAKTITADAEPVPYDYLVLACGMTHAYFGHDEWAEHAPGLKTVEDALEIRRRILSSPSKPPKKPTTSPPAPPNSPSSSSGPAPPASNSPGPSPRSPPNPSRATSAASTPAPPASSSSRARTASCPPTRTSSPNEPNATWSASASRSSSPDTPPPSTPRASPSAKATTPDASHPAA